MRVGNIDSWMKKRASHPDKEITNEEERHKAEAEKMCKKDGDEEEKEGKEKERL